MGHLPPAATSSLWERSPWIGRSYRGPYAPWHAIHAGCSSARTRWQDGRDQKRANEDTGHTCESRGDPAWSSSPPLPVVLHECGQTCQECYKRAADVQHNEHEERKRLHRAAQRILRMEQEIGASSILDQVNYYSTTRQSCR